MVRIFALCPRLEQRPSDLANSAETDRNVHTFICVHIERTRQLLPPLSISARNVQLGFLLNVMTQGLEPEARGAAILQLRPGEDCQIEWH